MLLVAFDTETRRFKPGYMAPHVVCLSWADSAGGKNLEVGKDKIEKWLHTCLDGALEDRLKLVGHNTAYDFACAMTTFPSVWDKVFAAYTKGVIHCTQTREYLLDIAEGLFRIRYDETGKRVKKKYTLASLADIHLGITMDKGDDTWRLRYAELEDVPVTQWPRAAINYAMLDASVTLEIAMDQERRARDIDYDMPTEAAETRAALALNLMSVWGVETDRAKVSKIWEFSAQRLNEIAAELVKFGVCRHSKKPALEFEGHTALPAVTKNTGVIRGLIEQDLGFYTPVTAAGNVKTDKNTIELCTNPVLQLKVEFDALQKNASTFISKLLQPVVHSRYNVLVDTSRTSSYEPNMQNQPRMPGIREGVRARDGHALVACDYDSQEMRTWAQLCLDIIGHSRLAQRYQENRRFDPHLFLASEFARISFEEATERYKADDKEIEHYRQHSKPANFGFLGGMGPEAYVSYAKGYDIDIDIEQASYTKGVWKDTWPEQADYFKYIGEITRTGSGTFVLPRSGFRRADMSFTQCANTGFQGSAAQISKRSLWEASRRCYSVKESALYGSRPVIFIHDENILEVPLDRVHDVALELEQLMVEEMEKDTPDVPAAASATAMFNWSKKAKRVIDNQGRLIPWVPKEVEE